MGSPAPVTGQMTLTGDSDSGSVLGAGSALSGPGCRSRSRGLVCPVSSHWHQNMCGDSASDWSILSILASDWLSLASKQTTLRREWAGRGIRVNIIFTMSHNPQYLI